MSEIQLTAEDQKILLAAMELYYLDWRDDDDDEKTAGWRHPGYFLEVNQPYDFSKLVNAGLMEEMNNPNYLSYRITQRGDAIVRASLYPTVSKPADSAPASPDAVTAPEGDELTYSYADLAQFYEIMVGIDAQNDAIEMLARDMYTDEDSLKTWADLTTICERLRDARKAPSSPAAGEGE